MIVCRSRSWPPDLGYRRWVALAITLVLVVAIGADGDGAPWLGLALIKVSLRIWIFRFTAFFLM